MAVYCDGLLSDCNSVSSTSSTVKTEADLRLFAGVGVDDMTLYAGVICEFVTEFFRIQIHTS